MSLSETKKSSGAISSTTLALVRLSRWHHLTPETLALVKAEVAKSLGLEDSSTNAGMRESARPYGEQDPAKLTPQMRHLIGAGAPWHVISDVLWQDYNSGPSPIKAARILETAFVQASPSETLDIFTRIMSSGLKGFYWYLHPKLRDFIVEHAPEQHLDHLYWVIARETDESKLSGIEMNYIFLRVAMTSDKTAAWMYFRRHKNKILDAFGSSRHFGLTKNQLVMKAGELALSLGYNEDAKNLFQLFPQDSNERETAVQMLLRFESNVVDRGKNSYLATIDDTPEWKDRLKLLSNFCDNHRKLGSVRDPNRSSLDLLLKSVLQWVPKNPEGWRMVGDLIIHHRDLANSLPGLLKPLFDNAVIYHGPDIDAALWHASGNIEPRNFLEQYLVATGLLHKYVTNPRLGESLLWDAQRLMMHPDAVSSNTPWTWRDLLKTGSQWLNNTTLLLDRDRKRGLAALRLAQDGVLASQDTVETYLSHCRNIPDGLLQSIAKNATASGNFDFAKNLIVKSGHSRAFTNKDLLNLWNMAVRGDNPDFSWRVATILSSRDSLPDLIKNSWEISGERRTTYVPITITQQDIECALAQISPVTKKICLALCIIGGRINDLAQINGASSHHSPPMTGSSGAELAIINALKTCPVLPKPTKSVVEARGVHMVPEISAPLAQSIINGPWLFALRLLAERLSIPAWGWSVSVLQEITKSVLPLIGTESSQRSSPKLSKWVLSLTSQERAAWAEVANSASGESTEQISAEMTKFICRLALLVYPSHLHALKTLQQLRMPLEVLRDLEWFVLCDEISSFRLRHNIANRVVIPETLKSHIQI